MDEKIIFTKEEIEAKVKVPAIVELELKHLIEDRFKQIGLYYRIFSRIKGSDSLARKYQIKSYNEEKKIQDLVGLRIDVYFEDDLRICRNVLEKMFSVVEWSRSQMNDIEFRSVKINGVFRLPEYLKEQISTETWDMCIDDTMEVQLKTVFFEGWHEIEHDMKYKGGELWSGKNSFARYFNSILATLELCDKSLVTLFENLGHELYKERNWPGMVKAHYRLKMEDRSIYPEVEALLNADDSENNLGKQIFKTKRQVLVDALLEQPRYVPINVNTMIALLNEAVIHDERLTKIFHERDVFDDGNATITEEGAYGRLAPLCKVPVFYAKVNLSTYKYSKHEACMEAARLTYGWIYEKYGRLEKNLPEKIERVDSLQLNMLGYQVSVVYQPQRDFWRMETSHIDADAPGQIWVMEASCYQEEDGRQMFEVRHSYATVESQRNYLNRYFSCPMFYSGVADRIGLFDVRYLSTSRRIIRERDLKKIQDLILSKKRTLPVCLIFSEESDNGWLDESWLENFRVYDFTRMAGRYTHIYTGSMTMGRRLLCDGLGLKLEEPSICIFRSMEDGVQNDTGVSCQFYTVDDVKNCRYGRRRMKHEGQRYDIVRGGQALYHKLLEDVRGEML